MLLGKDEIILNQTVTANIPIVQELVRHATIDGDRSCTGAPVVHDTIEIRQGDLIPIHIGLCQRIQQRTNNETVQ